MDTTTEASGQSAHDILTALAHVIRATPNGGHSDFPNQHARYADDAAKDLVRLGVATEYDYDTPYYAECLGEWISSLAVIFRPDEVHEIAERAREELGSRVGPVTP